MKVNSKIAVTWVEIILIAVLVISALGIWAFVDQQVNQHLESQEPKIEQFQQSEQLSNLQREFTAAQDELATIRKVLVEQRIELERQKSKLEALKNTYPQLLKLKIDTKTFPLEIIKAYKDAQLGQTVATNLVKVLESRTVELEDRVAKQSDTIFRAQESSSEKLEAARIRYEWDKRWLTLVWSVGVITVLMTLLLLILGILRLVSQRQLKIQVGIVWGGAAILQLILLGFQSFGVMGAALVSIIFLIILLTTLSNSAS